MSEEGDGGVAVEAPKRVQVEPVKRITIDLYKEAKPEIKFERLVEGEEFRGEDMVRVRTFLSRAYRRHKRERSKESGTISSKADPEKLKDLLEKDAQSDKPEQKVKEEQGGE